TVWITEPEDARTPWRVDRLCFEHASGRFDPRRELVDVLRRGELEREAGAFDAIGAFAAVVLREKNGNVARFQGHGHELALACEFAIDDESHDVLIPREARPDVGDGERRGKLACSK